MDYAYLDSTGISMNRYEFHTLDYLFRGKEYTFVGELGLSKFNDLDYDFALMQPRLRPIVQLTILPFDIEYFYIGKNVYNNNSEIVNTSLEDSQPDDPEQGRVLVQTGSALLGVGRLANNRTGRRFQ